MIRLSCPTCRTTLQLAAEHAGKIIACPRCKGRMRLPAPAQTSVTSLPLRGVDSRTAPPADRRYWLLLNEVPAGPFDVDQLRAQVALGEASGSSLVCPVGGDDWRPLAQIQGVVPAPSAFAATQALQDHAPAALSGQPSRSHKESPVPASSPGIWNPIAIGLLGIIFTPVWAGIMAALNGQRLGSPRSVVLPLAIGFGYVAVDVGVSTFFESMWVDFVLYFGALAAIWYFILAEQEASYSRLCSRGSVIYGGWLWPSLAGVSLALFFLMGVAFSMMPEPRIVCERFRDATSSAERARYATNNLTPALDALAKLDSKVIDDKMELTGEEPGPPDLGGHLVGFRKVVKEGDRYSHSEGCFHLLEHGGYWKVEDVFFVAFDRLPVDPPLSLARDYPIIISQLRGQPPAAPKANPIRQPDKAKTERAWYMNFRGWYAAVILIGGFLKWLLDRISGPGADSEVAKEGRPA